MLHYALAVGTHDPIRFSAGGDAEAIRAAVDHILSRHLHELADNPQEVATLLGPAGLVTRPSERIDEFVARIAQAPGDGGLQPGDTSAPDCNGD